MDHSVGTPAPQDSVLPDLLAPGLDILFCGTAAGDASARRRAYYAGPGNAFWPTLHEVGLTPRQFEPEEYAQLMPLKIGLTDIVKRASGSDSALAKQHFDPARVHRLIEQFHPRLLAFTSKRAAQEYLGQPVGYGLLPAMAGCTRLFVLPSPSGAARRYWSVQPWQELAHLRNERT